MIILYGPHILNTKLYHRISANGENEILFYIKNGKDVLIFFNEKTRNLVLQELKRKILSDSPLNVDAFLEEYNLSSAYRDDGTFITESDLE